MICEKKNFAPLNVGSGFKLLVSAKLSGGYHLKDVNFSIRVYNRYKSVSYKKDDAIEVDEDSYIVCVNTSNIGSGHYMAELRVEIPDADFADGIRIEKINIDTGETIV